MIYAAPPWIVILAILGLLAILGGIAYAIYRWYTSKGLSTRQRTKAAERTAEHDRIVDSYNAFEGALNRVYDLNHLPLPDIPEPFELCNGYLIGPSNNHAIYIRVEYNASGDHH